MKVEDFLTVWRKSPRITRYRWKTLDELEDIKPPVEFTDGYEDHDKIMEAAYNIALAAPKKSESYLLIQKVHQYCNNKWPDFVITPTMSAVPDALSCVGLKSEYEQGHWLLHAIHGGKSWLVK